MYLRGLAELFLHPPANFVESTLQSTLPASPTGNPNVQVTASGSTNTKGSYSTLIDPVNFDIYRMLIGFSDVFTAATVERVLVDIAHGDTGGGNEQIILPDLLAGGTAVWGGTNGCPPRMIDVPMYVPAGRSIRARCASNIASNTVRIWCVVWGGPDAPPWDVFTGCDAYGITAASSSGTSHTAGNSGADSSYASLGSTLSRDYRGLFYLVQNSQTVLNNLTYYMKIGYSSTDLLIGYMTATTSEQIHGPWPSGPVFQPLPSGTQLQVRGECSGTAQAMEVAAYCLY